MKNIQKITLSLFFAIAFSSTTSANTEQIPSMWGRFMNIFESKPRPTEIARQADQIFAAQKAQRAVKTALELARAQQRVQAIATADKKIIELNKARYKSWDKALELRTNNPTFKDIAAFESALEKHKQDSLALRLALEERKALGFDLKSEEEKHSCQVLGSSVGVDSLTGCLRTMQTKQLADYDAAIEERDENSKAGIFFSESDRTAFEKAREFEAKTILDIMFYHASKAAEKPRETGEEPIVIVRQPKPNINLTSSCWPR